MERFEIRLQPERRQELDALARETGLSSADVVRLAIRQLLEHRDLFVRGTAGKRAA